MVTNRKSIYEPGYDYIISRLRQARIDAGMKQEEVAEALGMYKSYVSKVEHGDRRIDIIELLEFSILYNKPLDFFVKSQRKESNKRKR